MEELERQKNVSAQKKSAKRPNNAETIEVLLNTSENWKKILA